MVKIIDARRDKDLLLPHYTRLIGPDNKKYIAYMFEGWGAAIVGTAVAGAAVSAASASSAASTEAGAATSASNASLAATQETNALQYLMYQQNLANESPFMQVQGEAEAALASGLGLSTPNTGANQIYGPYQAPGQVNPSGGTPPISNGAASGAPLTSTIQPVAQGTMSANSYNPTGSATSAAALTGTGSLGGSGVPMQPTSTPVPVTGTPPVSSAPTTSVPGIGNVGITNAGANQGQLNAGAGSQAPGSLLANFNNTDLNSQLNPSYNFILGTGEQQTANYDAAHGITGGQASRDQTNFNQNTASTFYQQAFTNYLTQQQSNIANLSSLAGNGSVGTAGIAASGAASGISTNTQAGVTASNNYLTSGASATAAGQIGVGNALTGALGTVQSGYYLNRMLPNTTQSPTAGLGG